MRHRIGDADMTDDERLQAANLINEVVACGITNIGGQRMLGLRSGQDVHGLAHPMPSWFPSVLTGPGLFAISALEAAGYTITPPPSKSAPSGGRCSLNEPECSRSASLSKTEHETALSES